MITYTDSIEGITSDMLRGFFEGWRRTVTPTEHLRILDNSHAFQCAVDEETGSVVGFITAVSDGILCAYLPLLEVLPAYRGQGIGTELVRRMFEKLDDIYMIDLMCDKELVRFYERFGFMSTRGMIIRNTSKRKS